MPVLTSEQTRTLTPMLRQYYEMKERCGDAILFFRMGDFYEIFGTDAEEVAPRLELVLTSRERGDDARIPFCGVPHHSARNYWLKLLKLGYKVAIADQLEDPKEAKGLVKRDITRIMTPGCVDDLEGLEQDAPNYLMAIFEAPGQGIWTLAVADVSTGELRLGNIASEDALVSAVEVFRPKELLARRFYLDALKERLAGYTSQTRLLLEALPEAPLRDEAEQQAAITTLCGTGDLASQPCGKVVGGDALLAALMAYVRSLQASLKQFLVVRPLSEPEAMVLDETAQRDLELFETARRRQLEGSLFREVNRTLSPMGARLLRYSLARPLIALPKIQARHAAVAQLVAIGLEPLRLLREQLKGAADLERLVTRLLAGNIQPTELGLARGVLTRAHDALAWLGEHVERSDTELLGSLAVGLRGYERPLAALNRALVPQPKPLGSGDGVFCEGFDQLLDQALCLARDGEAQVQRYEASLRERTGINSLKIKDHKTFGLLIEVTKPNLPRVPADFIRRQTMVNCERFTTIELQELSEALDGASSQTVAREAELYQNLLQDLAGYRAELRAVAEALARLDVLQGFAYLAIERQFCRPELAGDGELALKGARHPVVERYVGRHAFVPNDIVMTPTQRHLLITGPNMAGKSTVMRQVAICAILSQAGCFVPAETAKLPVFSRVFTRVGAADDLSRGHSTFMVEMAEAAHILRQADPKSLVILDEVGRGTSTQDGLAIASAILEDLALRMECYTLFATHYHELVPLAESLPSVRVVQTEVIENAQGIVFTHRLVDGASGSSFGLEVAKLAGLPSHVVARAQEFLAAHAEHHPPKEPKRQGARFQDAPAAVVDDSLAEIARRLENVKIHRTTPLQALNFLNDLKSLLHKGPQGELSFD